jgi:hypothetical protein
MGREHCSSANRTPLLEELRGDIREAKLPTFLAQLPSFSLFLKKKNPHINFLF